MAKKEIKLDVVMSYVFREDADTRLQAAFALILGNDSDVKLNKSEFDSFANFDNHVHDILNK
jgi:hypothetical protein